MSIIFSRQCEYALQAVSFLALQPARKKKSIKELASRLDIPFHFLGKILQKLVYRGILISQKGKGGGFALAKSPDKITLFHIVETIDGEDIMKQCVMGFPKCSGKHPCAVHSQWEEQRKSIYRMLVTENIAETAKAMKRPEYQS